MTWALGVFHFILYLIPLNFHSFFRKYLTPQKGFKMQHLDVQVIEQERNKRGALMIMAMAVCLLIYFLLLIRLFEHGCQNWICHSNFSHEKSFNKYMHEWKSILVSKSNKTNHDFENHPIYF